MNGGGVWARVGFAFQDHVTAGFCLQMVSDGSKLTAVWCEGSDDITLIWETDAGDEVEFVQVKSDEPKSLWSIAILCERDSKVKKEHRCGTSILEKSLACDRHFRESRRFRVVTAMPVNKDLEPLKYPFGSTARAPDVEKMKELVREVGGKVSDFKSERGNDYNFWLERILWDVRHCEETVRNENLLALAKWLEKKGIWLLQDQIESLYVRLMARVQEAAKCDPRVSPAEKKLLRDYLSAWIAEEARKIEQQAGARTGERLREKLEAANLQPDDIQEAAEFRRHFRYEQLCPRYVGQDDQQRIVREIGARLMVMRTRLDSGQLEDDGIRFHAECVAEVQRVPALLGISGAADVSFLLGCMYNITSRCPHRFRRAT